LEGPGYLFVAPTGSALPTHAVVGSVFTDAWASPWVALGATDEGMTWSYELSTEQIEVAEFLDPIKYVTSGRTASVSFNLASFTLKNLQRALNGAATTVTTVSGTGATLLSKLVPPAAGAEIRTMVGWQSWDNTVRLFIRQAINSGSIEMAFQKANGNKAVIPFTFNVEVPATGDLIEVYTAGVERLGT
jgi:hypothetical protein